MSTVQTKGTKGTKPTQAEGTKLASIRLRGASDPTRLIILLTLNDGESDITALSAAVGESQPAIDHHLALLRQDGLVHSRREGNRNVYSLTEDGHLIARCVDKLISRQTIDSSLLRDVGGFVDDPDRWFRTPNSEFEGRRPIDLLGTADEPRLRNRIEAAKLGLFS